MAHRESQRGRSAPTGTTRTRALWLKLRVGILGRALCLELNPLLRGAMCPPTRFEGGEYLNCSGN